METIIKEIKESMITTLHQIKTVNKERNYKRNPNGNSGVEKYNN